MNPRIIFVAVFCCYAVLCIRAEHQVEQEQQQQGLSASQFVPAAADDDGSGLSHARPKRTLFLKKKLLGAGLLGFGLGVAKGFKAGYHHGPEVHHVYVAPPVKYVEYVEKPVYVEKIVERPVYQAAQEYGPPWTPSEPSSSYGSSW